MVFQGSLFYKESSDYLEVDRLIFREDHLAFQVTTTWGDYGKWSIDGKAFKKDNEYVTEKMTSLQDSREGLPCIIRFRITSQNENEISVEGEWTESGEMYEFSGTLEKFA